MCAAFSYRGDGSVPDFQDDRAVGISAHYALSGGVVKFTRRVIAAQLLPAQSLLGCASWLHDGLLPRSSKLTFCSSGRCLAAVGCADPADGGARPAVGLRDLRVVRGSWRPGIDGFIARHRLRLFAHWEALLLPRPTRVRYR